MEVVVFYLYYPGFYHPSVAHSCFPRDAMNNGEKWRLVPKAHTSLSLNVAGEVNTVTDPQTGHVLVINRVARRILELCDGGRNVVEITKLIVDEFPSAAPERVAEDLDQFLAQAFQKNLITWAE